MGQPGMTPTREPIDLERVKALWATRGAFKTIQEVQDLIGAIPALIEEVEKLRGQNAQAKKIIAVAVEYVASERDFLAAQANPISDTDFLYLDVKLDVAWGNLCVAVDGWATGEKGKEG